MFHLKASARWDDRCQIRVRKPEFKRLVGSLYRLYEAVKFSEGPLVRHEYQARLQEH